MQIHEKDLVKIDLSNGHKYALRDIAKGEEIVKYGYPIGVATADIAKGEHVHSHNMRTGLGESETYEYQPKLNELTAPEKMPTFMGYRRKDGSVGIRNEIWVIPTVGCINHAAKQIAEKTGAFAYTHPFGCSQLGCDKATTEKILCGLIRHPNAAGVLVLGLGCENNNIPLFKTVLGEYNEKRVKFLNVQDSTDEIADGIRIIEELKAYAATFERVELPISRLKIGLKCGGSDGFSGITANPLVGSFSDSLIARGGSCVMTEVPEMFGAEHLLMKRCPNKELFDTTVCLINDFKDYFTRHNQVIYENPSPGNKAGGITTLEEKSLGCVQKGGLSEVADVLDYGDTVCKNGLNLLNGPGNDIVAITNLAAAGVHIILFTTGRGTPVGAPVPTVKIATNQNIAAKKANWIDFDASALLRGVSMEDLTDNLTDYIIEVASGKETCNERNGYREISIFKDGIVL